MKVDILNAEINLMHPVEEGPDPLFNSGGRLGVTVRLMYWDDFAGDGGTEFNLTVDLPFEMANRPINDLASAARDRLPGFLRELADGIEQAT